MDSGIYQITFPNGYFYLGKSETISQRWKTHQKNFSQGTHTKKMQAAYDTYGEPQYEVVLPVHPEHIGIYESIFINRSWNSGILNTTKPKILDHTETDEYLKVYDVVTLNGTSCMLHSTLQHVITLQEQYARSELAEARIKQLEDSGVVLPTESKQAMQELRDICLEQNRELRRLAKLSVYDRMFNYKVYV